MKRTKNAKSQLNEGTIIGPLETSEQAWINKPLNQPAPGPVPKKKPFRAFRITRKAGIIITSAILFIVGGLLLYMYLAPPNCDKSTRCQEILTSSAKALETNSLKDQAKIVDEIKKEPKYTKEPNYMFVITRYYINIGDSKNAKAYYEKLTKVYNKKKGYSETIKSLASSPDDLQLMIKYLEQQAKQAQQNFYSVPAPPQ